jgi:multicomponent K+:H+ antiporter subunit F
MILTLALNFAFLCFGLSLLMNLWFLARGSGIADRILAVDTMVINMIALIILYGISYSDSINFEAAMLFALTGFVSTVAFCKFLLRGDVIE